LEKPLPSNHLLSSDLEATTAQVIPPAMLGFKVSQATGAPALRSVRQGRGRGPQGELKSEVEAGAALKALTSPLENRKATLTDLLRVQKGTSANAKMRRSVRQDLDRGQGNSHPTIRELSA
jgi:hypothetical protein